MFKPLTQLNRFFELATERKLAGSDQLVYLHLFNKFNRAHWSDSISVRDAELFELCRLYDTNGKPASMNAIRNAKARLKGKGFIDFTSGKGENPTEYRLIVFDTPVDTPVNSPMDTPADTPADLRQSSYIRTREDVKDVKTINDDDEARARARAMIGMDLDPESILDVWEYETGSKLTGSSGLELEYLAQKDFKLVSDAIVAATKSKSTDRLRYVYFKKIFDDMKGGEKVDRQQSTSTSNVRADYSYKKPEYTDKPWETD